MSGQLAAAILAAPGSFAHGEGDQGQVPSSLGGEGFTKVAIIAARRLPVAALSALLLNEPGYRLVAEAHGTTEVRKTLDIHRPAVIVEARDDSICDSDHFPSSGEVTAHSLLACGGESGQGVHVVVGPQDRPDDFTSSVHAAISQVGTTMTDSQRPRLSGREWQILAKIASGKSTKQVARECTISAKTVGNHVGNICHKLDLHHRGQLVLFAAAYGLTSLEAAPA